MPEKNVKEIFNIKLPPKLKYFLTLYEPIKDRNPFLWKWVYHAVDAAALSSIDKKIQKPILEWKSIFVLFVTALDDVADKESNLDYLSKLLTLLRDPLVAQKGFSKTVINRNNPKTTLFLQILWKEIWSFFENLPRYQEFQDIIVFDCLQLLNSMHYSALANNNPSVLNHSDASHYLAHNMQALINFDLDLAASPSFDATELPAARRVFVRCQLVFRIANWLYTWERELSENDLSNGVIALALSNNTIKTQDLEDKKRDIDKLKNKIRRSAVEKELQRQIESQIRAMRQEKANIKSFDLQKVINSANYASVLYKRTKKYV
ncbi:hypothetical protein ACFL2B_02470 [Patescibacteria group bacterium]